MTRMHQAAAAFATTVSLIAALAACSTGGGPSRAPSPSPPASSAPPRPTGTSTPNPVLQPVQVTGDPVELASGLNAPWSILRLANGATLISERDTASVLELLADGSTRVIGQVDGVVPNGEGGLLGLAALEDSASVWIYAYFTAADDNRIVRMPLSGAPGSLGLGTPEPVLDGIAKAGNHDGGRIAFGPDGMLYATAGDAGDGARSQDPASLNGKILRMTPTGGVPDGNPFSTLVWSLGHRNPQGIAWDSQERMWASEFGQNTWDELNLITPGSNYGWPVVEGAAGDPAFVDPVQQWATTDASPSGLAIVSDTLFLAALRGERLWTVWPDAGRAPEAAFEGVYGRIRDVVPGADGTLWFITNNTDGRGDPRDGDDRLFQVSLGPAA
ncbi:MULTISPECIES: PQQ-dependent sugar dehydrogenase [unclassified Leifsonia]|uniref:PQQ-dependent sugar dehydrogenase n=1 Tax=unclassified Leifsonia TaxID=2663824 RepID=UPI0006F293C7|nr:MULTISPECIES: PQQ-dependent sugar dehydrogenase [unclassified Leifsonia]KQX07974.1 glucose dehydrogenase [Leifsonia sp. Root1293]KRA12255.1 glucose dehydrogenase [Leifsonia sp. Root60]